MSNCTVYIDEAGDLGVNRGTRWFVLSAVVVDKANEPDIRARLKQIRGRLNLQTIHMRTVSDFSKRGFIVREVNGEAFTYMNVLVDTSKFDAQKIPSSVLAYNYICKFLLERVSQFLESTGKTADIVLSARGTSRDGELIAYIRDKLLPYPGNAINGAVFEKISAKAATEWDLLQLADICATTMFWSYEVNGFGFCLPCFSVALRDHLYRKDGAVEGHGIKFFTLDMKPDVEALRARRVCAKNERTPGATST